MDIYSMEAVVILARQHAPNVLLESAKVLVPQIVNHALEVSVLNVLVVSTFVQDLAVYALLDAHHASVEENVIRVHQATF